MTGFFVALQFLTRFPSPIRRQIALAELGPSTRWFPIVGALIGATVAAVDAALAPVFGIEVRAVIAVLLFAVLTGALHLDGLMDSCDGLLAFTSPERRLEIMHDSRVGSFAVVGAATLLLVKYTAFLALPEEHRLAGFVAIGGLSRWAMVFSAQRYPSARPGGLGQTLQAGMRPGDLAVATATAFLTVIPAGPAGPASALAAWVATVILARYTLSKVPGLTGDVYGAICEIVEVVVAIALPPLWRLAAVS